MEYSDSDQMFAGSHLDDNGNESDFDRAIDSDEGYRDGESFVDDGPTCPTCGKEATFTEHADCNEEWLTCDECGAKTDERELEAK